MLNESLIIRIHLVRLNTALMCGRQVGLLRYGFCVFAVIIIISCFAQVVGILHFSFLRLSIRYHSCFFHSCIFSAPADGALAMVGVSSTVTIRAAAF